MPLQFLELRQLSMQRDIEGMATPARPHTAPRLVEVLAISEGAAATINTMSQCLRTRCLPLVTRHFVQSMVACFICLGLAANISSCSSEEAGVLASRQTAGTLSTNRNAWFGQLYTISKMDCLHTIIQALHYGQAQICLSTASRLCCHPLQHSAQVQLKKDVSGMCT